MQREIRGLFGNINKKRKSGVQKSKQPPATVFDDSLPTGKKPRLFSVFENLNSNSNHTTTSSQSTSGPIDFASFVSQMHLSRPPSTSRPATSRQHHPTIPQAHAHHASGAHPEQNTRFESVRVAQQATRLHRFATASHAATEAAATFRATEASRRAAAVRMAEELEKQHAEAKAKVAADKERLAQEARQREERQRVETILNSRRGHRCAGETRGGGGFNDGMWPQNTAQAAFYGDDYQRWKEEGSGQPSSGWEGCEGSPGHEWYGYGHSGRNHYERQFARDNPDDCWGRSTDHTSGNVHNGGRSSAHDTHAHCHDGLGSQGDRRRQGSEMEGNDDYWTSEGEEDEGDSYFETDDGYCFEADEDDDHFWNQWRGSAYEEFKRNWHKYSSQYHSSHYEYDRSEARGAAGGSNGDRTAANEDGAGHGRPRKEAALAAGAKALAAACQPARSEAEEEELRAEIERQVSKAARCSANNVAVFASALGVRAGDEDSTGATAARGRLLWKRMLLKFHPDKMQQAAPREQLLGLYVAQALNAMDHVAASDAI